MNINQGFNEGMPVSMKTTFNTLEEQKLFLDYKSKFPKITTKAFKDFHQQILLDPGIGKFFKELSDADKNLYFSFLDKNDHMTPYDFKELREQAKNVASTKGKDFYIETSTDDILDPKIDDINNRYKLN